MDKMSENSVKSEMGLTGHSNSRLTAQGRVHLPPPKIAVSFDRITVVGNLIPAREKRLKKHVETNIRINLRDTGFDRFKCQALENKVYVEYNRKQAQAMGRSEIRVEFNPNELNDEEMEFVQFIFLDNMRNKDFSRIDLAFDLEMDLSDYLVMSDKSIKKTIFYGRTDNPETKYFGVRDSERYIRIYDKKKQLSEVKRKDVSAKHFWRVEFELKHNMTNTWNKCFDDLSIIKPKYLSVNDFEEQAKLYYLINEQSAWSKLHRNTRYKYKKRLKELSDLNITELFKQELDKEYDKLSDQLANYIAISHHDKMFDFDFGV